MKKIFLSLTGLFAILAVHAQRINVGLKGGLNLASIDHNSEAKFSNRTAYNAGLFINVPVAPLISIQPEVVYSSQGAKYRVASGQEHSLALNYINIPVMVQANVGRGFYAEAGPQVGFLTSVKDKVSNIETDFFTSGDFKNTDVALGVGLGYSGTSGVGLNARYNFGLTDINDYGSTNVRNNVLQLGLTFRLSGRR